MATHSSGRAAVPVERCGLSEAGHPDAGRLGTIGIPVRGTEVPATVDAARAELGEETG